MTSTLEPSLRFTPGATVRTPDDERRCHSRRRPCERAASPPARVPGPWAGEVRRLVPGHEIETLVILEGHDDPIAQHHTLGGRKVSALDPSLKGLPVLPFAVMAEMTAQVAALAVTPGLVLTGLDQVRAHKWVRYEDEPVFLELRGRTRPSSGDERFWVGIFNRGALGKIRSLRPVFEAIAIFDVGHSGAAAGEPPGRSRASPQQVHRPLRL